jgi:hypothetical protein
MSAQKINSGDLTFGGAGGSEIKKLLPITKTCIILIRNNSDYFLK